MCGLICTDGFGNIFRHEGSSSQASGSAPWAVQHGWSHGAVVVESINNVSPVACPSGKCSVEVPAWPHSAELVCCGDPSEFVVASTVARSARKVVVLGEPFMGVAAAPWVKFPIIRKCTLGCSTRLEPWGGRGRINQQCFSCRLVPRKSVLSRCRPGLTVQGWFVAGIPRNCRCFYRGPLFTEGCGAR
ncbi:hypothetical protein Lal_00048569 [Lupinus albus]|nr:hypothetical protein Lal_00048569 [Lupinus albus]